MFEYPVTESRMKMDYIIRKREGYKNLIVFQNRDCQGADVFQNRDCQGADKKKARMNPALF